MCVRMSRLDLSSMLQERFSLSSGSVESERSSQPSCMVSSTPIMCMVAAVVLMCHTMPGSRLL